MKFEVDLQWLAPIEVGNYERVNVVLPNGKQVTVYSDHVAVQTPDQVLSRQDGAVVWTDPDTAWVADYRERDP